MQNAIWTRYAANWRYKSARSRNGKRAAIAKRFSGDAAPVLLFRPPDQVLQGVCLSAARSAALVQDKHTPCDHYLK